jgi:serine/threonine protein kinase
MGPFVTKSPDMKHTPTPTKVGAGTNGVVWQCPGSATVVKTFTSEMEWQREAAAYSAVKRIDPEDGFTPRVYSCHSHVNGLVGIQMEHAGVDLMAITRDRPQDVRVEWLDPVLRGLRVMAAHGYLHNDVRAENIMVQATCGRTLLVDFGLMSQGPRRDLCLKGKFAWWLPPDAAVFRCACLNILDAHPDAVAERKERLLWDLDMWRDRHNDLRPDAGLPFTPDQAASQTLAALHTMERLVRKARVLPKHAGDEIINPDPAVAAAFEAVDSGGTAELNHVRDALMTSDFYGLGQTLHLLACVSSVCNRPAGPAMLAARAMCTCNPFKRG